MLPLPMITRICRGRILGLIAGTTADGGTVLVVRLSTATGIVPRPRSTTNKEGIAFW